MIIESTKHFTSIELTTDDFHRYVPPLKFSQPTLKESAREYLDQCHTNLEALHEDAYHSQHLLGVHTLMIDRLLNFLFYEMENEIIQKINHHGPKACLIAQGGYGRGEMNLYSDIDLLFIYPKRKGSYIEMLTEKLLYLLWDLKLDVGYATRTITECKKLVFEDVTIMTSLLDIRYLSGDREVFDRLHQEMQKLIKSSSVKKKLVRQKMTEKKGRIKKHGNSVFMLEPNVKESHGGLRDLQTLLWIAKIKGYGKSYEDLVELGFLSQKDCETLLLARNFLWRIRNEIHLMEGKKMDVVSFARQEKIASRMGFKAEGGGILGVELFMQTYYKLAYQVATIVDSALRRMTTQGKGIARFIRKLNVHALDDNFRIVEGQIMAKSAQVLDKDPLNLMRLFGHVQERGIGVHPETRDHVRFISSRLDDQFRNNAKAIFMFRKMLGTYNNLGKALFAMHDCHFLDEWMPEFKKLRCRVQHDIYHVYTIDTHSIFAVNELSKLYADKYAGKFDLYKKVMMEIEQPELLTLGLLLHDIGKGEGGNHSFRGAKIAAVITARLNYSEDEKKTIDFLIQSQPTHDDSSFFLILPRP